MRRDCRPMWQDTPEQRNTGLDLLKTPLAGKVRSRAGSKAAQRVPPDQRGRPVAQKVDSRCKAARDGGRTISNRWETASGAPPAMHLAARETARWKNKESLARGYLARLI